MRSQPTIVMKKINPKIQHLTLYVTEGNISSFTTLLQGGVSLSCQAGQSIGVFLNTLPGFDDDYIINRIQTIFLDGSAIDDMEITLSKSDHVLALSAAMPGLAGAIFRKRSLHAALRTKSFDSTQLPTQLKKSTVLLKLFNMIAHEKGQRLLQYGGLFTGKTLVNFLYQSVSRLEKIVHSELDGNIVYQADFNTLLNSQSQYHVAIKPFSEKK